MLNILRILLVALFIQKSFGVSFIKPCSTNDKECIVNSSQELVPMLTKGFSEYDIPAIDPILLENERIDHPDLKAVFKHFLIEGANRSKIIEIIPNASQKTVKAVVDAPARFYGHYEVAGRLVGMDVHGNGAFDVDAGIVRFKVNADIKTYKDKQGRDHWKITKFDYVYDLPEKADFKLENLYAGNQEMSTTFHDLLHGNYKEIIMEFGTPFFEKLIKSCVENVNKLLSAVPSEEFIIS